MDMRFALVTEGVSEHRIIKHILEKYFREQSPFFRQIQPEIDNEKQKATGGWTEVLKFCTRDADILELFIDSDYLIIQIDTDQSQTKPFNISHSKPDNKLKTVEELHTDVVAKLKTLINPEIMEKFGNRIFFAITIHTVECWLLPLYFTNKHKKDINTCLSSLNTELRKHNISTISTKTKNDHKSRSSYGTILHNWRKKNDIIVSAQHNDGFRLFLESLQIIKF